MYICMYGRMCVCMYVCVYVRTYVCIMCYVCMYVSMQINKINCRVFPSKNLGKKVIITLILRTKI
jgi:hypothetical protein